MIFANGALLPDSERKAVLKGLEAQLNAVRRFPPLETETVKIGRASCRERVWAGV